MPPILSMALPAVNGEVDVKTAWIPGFDGFAIKVSPGFFDNPKRGLPSLNGLMILFSATTGLVEALFLDNGYLTDVRTAAAGAVAARHMAPATVETAGVLGTGVQARLQLEAAHLVRPFRRALVWGRDPAKAAATAADLARDPRHRRPPRARPRPPRRREPARRHHHPGPRADPAGRLAPPRPPRHRHGLRPVREERARPRRPRRAPTSTSATAPPRPKPSASSAPRSPPASGPAAPRPSSAPSSPAPSPAARSPRPSPSATSPAPAPRTPPSPPTRSPPAAPLGVGTVDRA